MSLITNDKLEGTKSNLLEYLTNSLKSSFPGRHSFKLQIIKSKLRRSYALFPHSTSTNNKIHQEEILILLSEELELPSTTTTTADDESGVNVKPTITASLPILALEANIYTIASSSTCLIYISKVDTTGLPPPHSPSPARTLISSYIAYTLKFPPHQVRRLRFHIFAKSQPQYLFPGSMDNPGKKVLDDKGLLRWWKGTLSKASEEALAIKEGKVLPHLKQFYFIPGLTESESLPYVPLPHPSTSSTTPPTPWIYSHAFSLTPSPLYPPYSSPSPPTLTDLIPAFPDDPKSRFLHSLSSSSIACSGTPDDYDDLHLSLQSSSFTVAHGNLSKVEEIERDRIRERKRLVEGIEGGVEEWWERLMFRQECCSGVLVGFFALVRDEEEGKGEGEEEWGIKKSKNELGSLDGKVFTSLWSQFHNVDYAWTNLNKLVEATKKWEMDLENLILLEGSIESLEGDSSSSSNLSTEEVGRRRKEIYEKEVKRDFVVDNPKLTAGEGSKKRNLVAEEKIVNVMVPRKKKPKVVPVE